MVPHYMGGVPDYPVNELESIQRRSLDIIGLPRDFLRKKENNMLLYSACSRIPTITHVIY
jgi:hypothetical protein